MKVLSLDHLVLTVRSVSASAGFYAEVLGMRVQTTAQGRTSLHFGRQKINLHEQGREFEPKAHTPLPGSADICLIMDAPLERMKNHLEQKGVPVELGPVDREGALGPMRSLYIRDPDDNLVELAVYPAEDSK